LLKSDKAKLGRTTQLKESSSNNSMGLIKSPRKFSSLLNKLFNITDDADNESHEFTIDFPIPEMEIEHTEKNNQLAHNDTKFWFNKGKETCDKGAFEPAIDLYIQGLRVDNKHYQSYHNLG
jgi:hypothetical protein